MMAGITPDSLSTYFHYFDSDKKSIALNTIKLGRHSGITERSPPVTIEGKLLGITSDEERVVVYTYEKKTYQLKRTDKVDDNNVFFSKKEGGTEHRMVRRSITWSKLHAGVSHLY